MARGSSGGGGSRGGSSGGGSRGGSYRSGGGSSGRSRSYSSPSRGYSSGPSHYHSHHDRYYGGHGYSRSTVVYRGPKSPMEIFLDFISTLLIVAMVIAVVSVPTLVKGGSIGKSTVAREKLDPQYVDEVPSGWYDDRIGWIKNDATLVGGLKAFYKYTGVRPYLILTEDIEFNKYPTGQEVQDYAAKWYDANVHDEGHIVFVMQCIDETDEYKLAVCTGKQAKVVMDDEACNILYDYIDSYWYSNRSEAELFGDAFEDAGKRVMTKTPNYTFVVIIVALTVVGLFVVLQIVKASFKRKREAAAETERILSTPIDQLGDSGGGGDGT